MSDALIKAHLNLCAVLQNLEELVRLDPEMAILTKSWDLSIQFSVAGGPAAYVGFTGGICTHGLGRHPSPSVKLFFFSPGHCNKMFDGKGNPVPLKGFTKLGFLSKQFSKLTDRLSYYLKPGAGMLDDPAFRDINTALSLYTGVYAVKVLAEHEPLCKGIAAGMPQGTLAIRVQNGGPAAWLNYGPEGITAGKGIAEAPLAAMTFTDMTAAHEVLSGKLDSMQAIGLGKLALSGMLPLVENTGLILDRVEGWLQ
jgi:hypothetical protein